MANEEQETGKYLIKEFDKSGYLGYYTEVIHAEEDIIGFSDGPSVRAIKLDNHYLLEFSRSFLGSGLPFGIEDISKDEKKIKGRLLKKLEELCLDKNYINSVFKPKNPNYEIIYNFNKSKIKDENEL